MTHSIHRCTEKPDFGTARRLVTDYHSYIEWADRPSRKLYWLLLHEDEPVGVFGLSSAFIYPKPVRAWMEQNHLVFNEVGNNIVYCLKPDLPRNSGTRFLAQCRGDAQQWWAERYGDALRGLQTFILPPRTGALYKADNWQYLGQTTGTAKTTHTVKVANPAATTAERRVFRSGEVKYLVHSFAQTPQKLIFVKLLA